MIVQVPALGAFPRLENVTCLRHTEMCFGRDCFLAALAVLVFLLSNHCHAMFHHGLELFEVLLADVNIPRALLRTLGRACHLRHKKAGRGIVASQTVLHNQINICWAPMRAS